MSNEILNQLADAFEYRPGRLREEVWLPAGFTRVLAVLDEYDDVTEETWWASALLMVVMERGGTCLPIALLPTLSEYSRLPDYLRQHNVEEWRVALSGGAISNAIDEVRPLVVHNDRLYFDRLLRLERDVASRITAPIAEGALAEPAQWEHVVDEVFGTTDEADLQRNAAREIFRQRVSILAGGPGTGKTFTVAKLLISLYRVSNGQMTIRLCAPTGKAAQRIKESLSQVVGEIAKDISEQILSSLQPTTIHSLLKITPLSSRRQRSTPLHVDFVICDETSMVDLALLDELLRSISDRTRLLLVGDPNQLQSVDVGSVMLDLVEAIRSGLPGSMLKTVHRVMKEAESNESTRETILRFFEHIREGDVDEALEILSSDNQALRHVDIVGDQKLGEGGDQLKTEVFARARDLISEARKSSNVDVWRPILNRTMVLAAQHQGPFSRTWWVDEVAKEIGYAEEVSPTFVGLPVLVTKTDRGNGVINGDTGLIVAQDDFAVYRPSTSSTGADAGDKSATQLTPTAIHEWQPWWAMTIHKSQGSEFDNVVVSITPGTRLLSRELLYTAVTRAKSQVTIVGRLEDIRHAIQSPAERFSGLAEILHEAIQVGHNSSIE